MNHQELERQRQDILKQMGRVRTMRRGSVSEQFLKVRRQGETEPAVRGPYYLWQYWVKGKPVRQRLRTPDEVAAARREVAAYKEFTRLCEAYVRTTEALGTLERETSDSLEALKKTPKSRSRRARK
jgi:hypothetical protein